MRFLLDTDDIERREPAPGITVRVMSEEGHTKGLVEIAPNAVMPKHSHGHDQSGFVRQGAVEFTISGVTRIVRQGESYFIPGGVEFSLVGSDQWSVFLGIFDSRETPNIN